MGEWISANITLPARVTLSDEMENAYSHFIGLALALFGFLIIAPASSPSGHPLARTGMIIFALTNIVLYASSAFYHYLKPGTGKKIMRVLDHSSIYLLIAGSYTPVLLYIGTPLTAWYTAGIWLAAAAGIVLTLRFWGRFYPLHIALYAVMGWSIVTISGTVLAALPHSLVPYMIAGGVIYTTGILFYAVKKIPHHHLIWHIFVLAGSLSFYAGYCLHLLA